MAAENHHEQHHIDALLERYLALLNEYTRLRSSLAALHAGMHQALARANFSADRAVRYGRDHYCEGRMRALRRVILQPDQGAEKSRPGWRCLVATCDREEEEEDESAAPEAQDGGGGGGGGRGGEGRGEEGRGEEGRGEEGNHTAEADGEELVQDRGKDGEARKRARVAIRDPIGWFGLMAPSALRQAQARAVESVAEVVPRLVAVDAEMKAVEAEVGRLRDRRVAAGAAGVGQRQDEACRDPAGPDPGPEGEVEVAGEDAPSSPAAR